ncbi:hypothetical protein M378DRAFT_167196, partial [Amanita muscaria Koide BX008]
TLSLSLAMREPLVAKEPFECHVDVMVSETEKPKSSMELRVHKYVILVKTLSIVHVVQKSQIHTEST